jgi:indolepyruvate ferredoxin oxidoreductase alpha subunit
MTSVNMDLGNNQSIGCTEASETEILLGNEAVVKGLLESRVGFTTAYPGTPSTEIQMQLHKIAEKEQLFFEYSVNEKVAMEMAGAAALSGVRSAVVLKHVGLNVASDALMGLTYFGVNAGMVIIVVDDPGCLSSQNEQDSRFWGKFAHIPIFEPANAQEIRDFIIQAYELSEKYQTICMVRLTNFTAHNSSKVCYNDVSEKLFRKGSFEPDYRLAIPARYILHKALHNKISSFKTDETFLSLNRLIPPPDHFDSEGQHGKLIITHGAVYPIVNYLREYLQLGIPILKVGAIYPLQEKQWLSILANYSTIYFIEELESYLEDEVLKIIGKHHLDTRVFGKTDLALPEENRLTPAVLQQAFKRIMGDPTDDDLFVPLEENHSPFESLFGRGKLLLPRTLPRLCNGCPHRAAFYSIKKAIGTEEAIIPSDIGCYALGQVPPIAIGDFWLCMGGGIGTALGFSKTNNKPVIAIIGDGTFFHAGLPPLVDAVLYNHNVTVAILNNSLTAMTGGQPTPSTSAKNAQNQTPIDLEQVVRGIGVKYIYSVDVEDVYRNTKIFQEAINYDGPAVVIFNGKCMIEFAREGHIPKDHPIIDPALCNHCCICLTDFGCPAIYSEEGTMHIDPESCVNCGVCVSICPRNAIKK